MPYKLIQAQSPTELVDLMDGPIYGALPLQIQRVVASPYTEPQTYEYVFPVLNGLKMVFTTPVVTVTFATADPISIADMLSELNTQVQAADANFIATVVDAETAPGTLNPPQKRLRMATSTPAGLVLNLDDDPVLVSTAASVLGFPTADDRTVAGAPVDSTKVVFGGDSISGSHYMFLAP